MKARSRLRALLTLKFRVLLYQLFFAVFTLVRGLLQLGSSNTIASIADKSMICLDAHRSAVQRSTHIARPGVRVSPFCAHHKLRRTDGDASSMLASTHSAGFLHVGGTPLPTKAMRVQSAQNRRHSSCTVMLSLAARV